MIVNINQSIDKFLRLRDECSKIHIVCSKWGRSGMADDRDVSAGLRLSWSLARTLTGWLRSEPDWRIHPRCALADDAGIRLTSLGIVWKYDSVEARRRWLMRRLRRLTQELRDLRAITSSREMSSTMGRYEVLLSSALAHSRVKKQTLTSPASEASFTLARQSRGAELEIFWAVMHDWPYMAV